MNKLLSENLLSLTQAASRIPPYRGEKTAASTIWRWINDGAQMPDGTTLRLEGVRLCERWLTSAEAMDRFLATQDSACNRKIAK